MATSFEADPIPLTADPRPTSLRLRLLALAAVSIAATLTVAGLSFAYIFEDHVERLVEQELDVRWRELAGAVALGPDRQPTLIHDLTDPRYQLPNSGAYWRIAEGQTVWMRSRSLWDEDLAPTETVHLSPTGKAIEQRGPNHSTVYMMQREVRFEGDGAPRAFSLAVALDTAPTDALRRSFVIDVGVALGLIGLVLFAGVWLQASGRKRGLTAGHCHPAPLHAHGETGLSQRRRHCPEVAYRPRFVCLGGHGNDLHGDDG